MSDYQIESVASICLLQGLFPLFKTPLSNCSALSHQYLMT